MSLQVEDLVSYTGAEKGAMKRTLVAAIMAAIPATSRSARLLSERSRHRRPAGARRRHPGAGRFACPAPGCSAPPNRPRMVKQYCTGCHNDRAKAGQLSLAAFDASNAANPEHVVTTEKMIRKLRAGMMPPASARRPEPDQITALADGARVARSIAPRSSIPIRDRVRSSASTAPSTAARSRTCSASTSTSPACCPPTRSATASTTSPTRRRFPRR